MVHRREISGTPIVLGNQGALWGNAMTWFDHETGSVWSQPLGEAILGPLKGTTLELVPSTLTLWGDWRETHPGTLALDAPSITSGFDLETMAIVVELGDDSVAFPVPSLRTVGATNARIGETPVAVVLEAETDNWAVFSRLLDDDELVDVELADRVLTEICGPRQWEAATGLPLGDTTQRLDLLPGFTSFQADYETFFPLGAFWQPDGPLIPVN